MDDEQENSQSQRSVEDQSGALTSAVGTIMVVARFHHVDVSADQVRHQLHVAPGPVTEADMVRVFGALGFQAKAVDRRWDRLSKLPLPAVLCLRDGGYCILAKIDGDQALLQYPGVAPGSRTHRRDEVEAEWTGRVILATRKGEAATPGRFGLRWFVAAIKRYHGLLREVLLASAFIQLFALLTPLVFMIIIDKVLSHQRLSTLDVLIFALAIVVLFEVVLGALRAYLLSHATHRLDLELGRRLFRHLLGLPLAYFDARRVGDTVARMHELEGVRRFLTGSALTLLLDLCFTVVFIAVMFLFSPFLTAVVLLSLPVLFGVSFFITPLLRGRLDDKFARGAENQSFLVEAVSGIQTLKGFAVEPQIQRQWDDRLAAYVQAGVGSTHLATLTQQTIGLINKAVTVLLLYLGAKLVMAGALTVGQLIAFNMLASRVNAPILRIAQIWQEIQQMRISVRRLADILDVPTEPLFRPGRARLPEIRGAIRFEHVSFRYRKEGPEALADVSFEIAPGEVVGVVGASGSGKTTLIKLLQRLYVPERGRILIDGVDIAMVDAAWLRRRIGVVGQDAVLFNRSVRDNIALGRPELGMERIIEVARLACAHEFILELPDGYDTVVGERGAQLSAGERQRIAIARALAGDPAILLLDEATSYLDYESERLIQANMRKICEGRTVFIVAHRLSTLEGADRILTFQRGRLVENADPHTLAGNGGPYARLRSLHQAGLAPRTV